MNAHHPAPPSARRKRVRATLPEMTQERRKEFVKIVRDKAEQARVAVRNIRRHAKDGLDGLTEVGEDEVARGEGARRGHEAARRRDRHRAQEQGSRAAQV